MTRVRFEKDNTEVFGWIVARREKTRHIYVVVDDNPTADDWYPVTMWRVVADQTASVYPGSSDA